MKQPLSVIVPCKNERSNIAQCIESFRAIADEILIADSGSTDDTLEIATRYDKTILSFESFLNLAAVRLWLKSFVNRA